MISREILVRPIGLVTEPNKVGQFRPGALARAQGARIRSPGTLEAARKWRAVTGSSVATSAVYAASDSKHVVFIVRAATNWIIVYVKSDLTVSTLTITPASQFYPLLSTDGRMGIALARDRLVITTPTRSFVVDLHLMPTTLPQPRLSGIPQIAIRVQGWTAGAAGENGPVPSRTHVTFCGVSKRVASDGYERISVPTVPSEFINQFEFEPFKTITFDATGPYDTSGIWEQTVEVYRTRSQSIGFDSGTNKYTPISNGQNHYLTKTVTRTGYGDFIVDNTLQSALGEALYTNTAVSGAASLPLVPPPAKCAAAFRGHVFYGNRFDPASFSFRVPVYWGFLEPPNIPQATLENAIGWRYSTGLSTTSGSAVVSGLANTYGVVPGQKAIVGLPVSSYTSTVVSTTATTVTLAGPVPETTASAWLSIYDMIEINGVSVEVVSPESLNDELAFNFSETFDYIGLSLEPSTAAVGTMVPRAMPSNGVTLRARSSASFTLRATNGANYSPPLPEINATPLTFSGKWLPNSLAWSEENQPEAVPPGNYAYAEGSEIYAMIGTRDCLWIFTSSGLSRLSGTGGSAADGYDWVIDPVDKNLILSAPRAFCENRDVVYAYTNRGVVSISSEGAVRELSASRIGDILPGARWSAPEVLANTATWMAADPEHDDIYLRMPNGDVWVYNSGTDAFTQGTPSGIPSPIAAVYSTRDGRMIGYAASTGNVVANDGTGYEPVDIRFQPLYGPDPFSHKLWLSADVSFDGLQETGLQLTFKPNDSTALASTREIPVSSSSPYQDKSRVGFTVPRNAPASANMLAASFQTPTSATPVKLQGVRFRFNLFSDQRRRR